MRGAGGGVRRIIGVRRSQGAWRGALLRALESEVLVCVAHTDSYNRHEGQNFQLGSSADETKEPIIGEAPHLGRLIDSSSPLFWGGSLFLEFA